MSNGRYRRVAFAPLSPARVVPAGESDAEQARVTECRHSGPCIVFAGPGAGKSHCLICRLKGLLRESADFRVLVLTFTVPGSEVLGRRVKKTGMSRQRVVVRRTQQVTWRAFAAAHRDTEGRATLSVAAQAMARRLLAQAVRDECLYPVDLERIVRRALKSIEELTELPADIAAVIAPGVLERYHRLKARERVVDNGDVRKWAMENAEEIVAGWVAEGYTHVFLDEAQDSSPAEIALMEAVARAGMQVCCVLDLRQALYGFRGARARALVNALVCIDGSHTHVLVVNRRSAARPIATLNAFAAWAFDGETALPMSALRVGGEPFRAVVCEEAAEVCDGLGTALAAVAGLTRANVQHAPKADAWLRDALGLPEKVGRSQSIGILAATAKEADSIVRALEAVGFAPVRGREGTIRDLASVSR